MQGRRHSVRPPRQGGRPAWFYRCLPSESRLQRFSINTPFNFSAFHEKCKAWPILSSLKKFSAGAAAATLSSVVVPSAAGSKWGIRGGTHGAIGPSALQVLHALLFDFLNYTTGRLDPSYAAIAWKANLCKRAVADALKRLHGLGIITWIRRCSERWIN